jgi:DNA-directed RNA polymerase specialized sigma subunit
MVDELPKDQRRVVRMRFAEEKSLNEIALSQQRRRIKQFAVSRAVPKSARRVAYEGNTQ